MYLLQEQWGKEAAESPRWSPVLVAESSPEDKEEVSSRPSLAPSPAPVTASPRPSLMASPRPSLMASPRPSLLAGSTPCASPKVAAFTPEVPSLQGSSSPKHCFAKKIVFRGGDPVKEASACIARAVCEDAIAAVAARGAEAAQGAKICADEEAPLDLDRIISDLFKYSDHDSTQGEDDEEVRCTNYSRPFAHSLLLFRILSQSPSTHSPSTHSPSTHSP
jgi:hypothetical protein